MCFAVQKGNRPSKALPIEKLIVRFRSYVSHLFRSLNFFNQNQSRGASPHTRPRRTARPILLGCSKTPLTELKAPWALSVLMLSRQTLIPNSTDAISASMPRSRNERKCPAATPRGGELLSLQFEQLIPKYLCLFDLSMHLHPQLLLLRL